MSVVNTVLWIPVNDVNGINKSLLFLAPKPICRVYMPFLVYSRYCCFEGGGGGAY